MDNDKPIEWSIKTIKELEFLVNESIKADSLDTNYSVTIDPQVETEELRITISFSFHKSVTHEVIMRSSVMTIFLIRNLKSFSSRVNDADAVDLPNPLWFMLFGISFTHTRAIMSRSSAGSIYSHLLMPPINPEVEFKKLFGEHLKA